LVTPKTFNAFHSTGRFEFSIFLVTYLVSVFLQTLTIGAWLEQGSQAIVVFTALHAGTVAALFWILLANALVSMQVVVDGSLGSLVVRPSLPCILHPHAALCIIPDP